MPLVIAQSILTSNNTGPEVSKHFCWVICKKCPVRISCTGRVVRGCSQDLLPLCPLAGRIVRGQAPQIGSYVGFLSVWVCVLHIRLSEFVLFTRRVYETSDSYHLFDFDGACSYEV